MDFTSWNLENDGSCSYDGLRIYDGADNTATSLGVFCSNSPNLVTASGTCLHFEFYSDDSVRRLGWAASLSCVGCNPDVSVAAIPSTCTDGLIDANTAYLELTATNGDRVNYSLGDIYTGDTDYANATPIGALPYTIVGGLANPTISETYTIRVFKEDSGCFTDKTVVLDNKVCEFACSCTDYLYVNDPTLDITHKFEIDANGGITTEIGSPWLASEVVNNPHGVVGDINGFLYISQIDQSNDPATNQLFQLNCAGEVVNSNIIPDWFKSYNLASDKSFIYAIGNDTGIEFWIRKYDFCTGNLVAELTLTDGEVGWGMILAPDGYIYFTTSWGGIAGDHKIYRTTTDLTSMTEIFSIPNTNADEYTLGVAQDEYGNFYMVVTDPNLGPTTIYKINPTGTIIDSITDSATDESGFAGAWGIQYYAPTGKLYTGTLGDDCVAVIDAGGESGSMTYQAALGVPHEPSTYSKAMNIVSECCPIPSTATIDITLCVGPLDEPIYLQDLINCNGIICEGNWQEDPTNTGMTYNSCDNTVTIDAAEACGSFSLQSDGLNTNKRCGAFDVNVTIEVRLIADNTIEGEQTVCAGESPTIFTSNATVPSGTPNFQWQMSTVSCSEGFVDIAGETEATYQSDALSQTTYFRMITSVDGTCSSGTCSDISNCITITVENAPTLSVIDAICDENAGTYIINFTSDNTVTSDVGTVSGNQVIDIPTGTNATLSSTIGGCTVQETVIAPDCASCVPNTCVPLTIMKN